MNSLRQSLKKLKSSMVVSETKELTVPKEAAISNIETPEETRIKQQIKQYENIENNLIPMLQDKRDFTMMMLGYSKGKNGVKEYFSFLMESLAEKAKISNSTNIQFKIDIWFHDLIKYPIEAIKKSFDILAKTEHFFPSFSQVVEKVEFSSGSYLHLYEKDKLKRELEDSMARKVAIIEDEK